MKDETDEGRKIKVKLHQMRMNNTEEEDFQIDKEDFEDVLSKFKKKSTSAYDLIVKSHKNYQEAIFELCKLFIEKEDFPDLFQKQFYI